MRLLLDTQAVLSFVMGSNRLSGDLQREIQDDRNQKFVSVVSLWEIAIKVSIGKLILHVPFRELLESNLEKNGFIPLPITNSHFSNSNAFLTIIALPSTASLLLRPLQKSSPPLRPTGHLIAMISICLDNNPE